MASALKLCEQEKYEVFGQLISFIGYVVLDQLQPQKERWMRKNGGPSRRHQQSTTCKRRWKTSKDRTETNRARSLTYCAHQVFIVGGLWMRYGRSTVRGIYNVYVYTVQRIRHQYQDLAIMEQKSTPLTSCQLWSSVRLCLACQASLPRTPDFLLVVESRREN